MAEEPPGDSEAPPARNSPPAPRPSRKYSQIADCSTGDSRGTFQAFCRTGLPIPRPIWDSKLQFRKGEFGGVAVAARTSLLTGTSK
jgi:hypothetical protein